MQLQRIDTSGRRAPLASRIVAASAAVLACAAWLPASAATLERIAETGHIKLGYLADARPFTSRAASGSVDGYGAVLCQKVAEHVKTQLNLPQLAVDWVPVTLDDRLNQVQQGNVDLLCTPLAATIARRQQVSFSIPVFPAGVRAVVRKDAPKALRDSLGENPVEKPVWRGSPAAKLLEKKTFAVVAGTTTESWLASRLSLFQIDARTVKVADYRTGLQQLLDRKVDVFFGDRAVVLGALDSSTQGQVDILGRLLTHEPATLALARGDEDFRLLVDRTLSEVYGSVGFDDMFSKWFGGFDDKTRSFFLWSTLTP